MDFECNWVPGSQEDMLPLDFGCAIEFSAKDIISAATPDLLFFYPFDNPWSVSGIANENCVAVTVHFEASFGPRSQEMSDDAVALLKKVPHPDRFLDFHELHSILGVAGFSKKRFTYIGPRENGKLSWPHISKVLVEWINNCLAPDVFSQNEARIRRVISVSPNYDVNKIMSSLWILECEEEAIQGTAFEISGLGLVTCNHVLGMATKAFKPSKFTEKYDIEIVKFNQAIDLAIIQIDHPMLNALEHGSAENINQLDHIAIAGFPNYRYGDSGLFTPGMVTGFRTFSGIRRIITNAPIVAGNSGGPLIDKTGKVIGVAATGAERLDIAHLTEKHGLIPIEALSLF